MASTALKNEDDKKEYFDPLDKLDEKITHLAKLIQNSKSFIMFTGAGISTSTGIADYRSGYNTVLPTGPGFWEKQANAKSKNGSKATSTGKQANLAAGQKKYVDPKLAPKANMTNAKPSLTHMAMVELMRRGLLKKVISQNIDGLHVKSGLNPVHLSEVHGNRNCEICRKCDRKFFRDFGTRTPTNKNLEHITTRKCPTCDSPLYDSIINFGENLRKEDIENGFEWSLQADLCIAIGSSLTVTPAADMPKQVGVFQKDLVIVNLQKTPLDQYSSLKIHAFCDQVFELLMAKLRIPIPAFKLDRKIALREVEPLEKQFSRLSTSEESKTQTQHNSRSSLSPKERHFEVRTFDYYSNEQQYIKKAKVFLDGKLVSSSGTQPLKFRAPQNGWSKLKVIIEFFGYYKEPDFEFTLDNQKDLRHIVDVSFEMGGKAWKQAK